MSPQEAHDNGLRSEVHLDEYIKMLCMETLIMNFFIFLFFFYSGNNISGKSNYGFYFS